MNIFDVMLHWRSFFDQFSTNIAGNMNGLMHSFDVLLQDIIRLELLVTLITQEHPFLLVKFMPMHLSQMPPHQFSFEKPKKHFTIVFCTLKLFIFCPMVNFQMLY